MEKGAEHYMGLPYTVELKPDGKGYKASVKELPGCRATVDASESVGELWRRLEEARRQRIEELLELGEEVPEPAGESATDPFWGSFPDGLDEEEAHTLLYGAGAAFFPLRILVELWLGELVNAGLAEVGPSRTPIKGGTLHLDQLSRARTGDLRPVRLGKGCNVAWVRFEGPRTKGGYKDVDLLDQPLLTEAAVVASLTVLEASVVRDADFERLREALREYVEANPRIRENNLEDVLRGLPSRWFSAQKAAIDEETKELPTEARKKRSGQSWERWERNPRLWRHTLIYQAALLRHRQPDFDARPLDEQLNMLDQHRKRVNGFLAEQRKHAAFLEYGTARGLPKAVRAARDQVKAAVLADVEGRRHIDLAPAIGLEVPEEATDRYKVDMKIPQVSDMVRAGRLLLDAVLGKGGWQEKAAEMRAESDRYKALSDQEKEAEALAENMGWTVEQARDLYQTNPEIARFLATPL